MALLLTPDFIRNAQRTPFEFTYRERVFVAEAAPHAELQIREGRTVVGFITPYGELEHGAAPANRANVLPVIVRTLQDALREILL